MNPNDLDELLAPFPRQRRELLPLLIALQERAGYLSETELSAAARHLHIPESEVFGVATSYSELRLAPSEGEPVGVCSGLSCLLKGASALAASLASDLPAGWTVEERPCRFRCDEAPVASVRHQYVAAASRESVLAAVADPAPLAIRERSTPDARPGETRRLLARCGVVDPESIDDALSRGAYDGLRRASALDPAEIVRMVEDARLLGRGGAHFPTALKWKTARNHAGPRYLVVNAEEGEPGIFKDRHLIERDPHLLVEGIFIAARAVEAAAVYIYINGEAELATSRLQAALDAARTRGLLHDQPPFEIRRGAGGYVCGEESVILSSIEGDRAMPRLRPPLPAESGLWGRPTVINNVETLCNLPCIMQDGPEAFRSAGTPAHPGTKIVCVSGAVRDPGVYEVPFGTTLRHVIEVIAGGPTPGRTLRAALCGGPSGTLLPPALWDAPLAPGQLDSSGASPGAGGIVLVDHTMSIRDVVRQLTAYNAAESCGKCTPCREGTARMRDLLAEPPPDAAARLDELAEAACAASLCGLGQMAPLPYLSARRHFGDEFLVQP